MSSDQLSSCLKKKRKRRGIEEEQMKVRKKGKRKKGRIKEGRSSKATTIAWLIKLV